MVKPYSVVVIGGGLSGMTAALCAARKNEKVLILESGTVGNLSSEKHFFTHMNAIDPVRQGELGISDSPEFFYRQTLKSGEFRGTPELVKEMCYKSYDTKLWLESLGIGFKPKVRQIPGGDYPRTAFVSEPDKVKRIFLAHLADAGVDVLSNAVFDRLEKDADFTVGFKFNDSEIRSVKAEKVILACGGFGANASMCRRHDPRTEGILSIASPFQTGMGIREGIRLGAAFVGMDFLECGYGLSHNGEWLELRLPPSLYLLVNEKGRRVADETNEREVLEYLLSSPSKRLIMVFDQKLLGAVLPEQRKLLEEILQKGKILNPLEPDFYSNLFRTLSDYNRKSTIKEPDAFGKIRGTPIFTRKPYLLPVIPALKASLGGLRVNENTEVISRSGTPIPGLYAIGTVAGGIHGTHMVPGNKALASLVFGRIAGEQCTL